MPSGGDNLIPLAKGSVLYLGSAVPLETSVGLEALQMPLRDRYMTTDQYQKVSGIDSVLTVFSSGILMQYPGDDSSSTWFPMQTLHMCAAVKAVSGMGSPMFVSVDSPQALASREPPVFAVIMRRSRGVKVLECHVFVCKSTDAALAFVQSCTHSFQHQEGWMNGMPGSGAFGSSSRIVAADSINGSSMVDLPRTPLQGFMYSPDQQTQMYNLSGMEPARLQAPAPVQAPPPAPVPAPAPAVQMFQQATASVQMFQQPTASAQMFQQPTAAVQPLQYVTMNPPGAPVPQMPQMMIPQGYFADWDQNNGMTYMVAPNSPLYPGDAVYNKEKKKRHKKKKNKKKSKSKQKDDGDEEEEEEELYYVRRSKLNQGQLPPDFVEVQQGVQQGSERYSVQPSQSEIRYVSEPVRPPAEQSRSTEIHYIPLPRSSQQVPTDYHPPDMIADIYLDKQPQAGGYFYEDQGPPPSQIEMGFDPNAYRVQAQDFDYNYGRDYDASRQQIYPPGSQGVYDMRLPRTNVEYDERGFNGMAGRLGYIP